MTTIVLNRLSVVKIDGAHFLQQTILYGPGGSQDSDDANKAKDGVELIGRKFKAPDSNEWIIVDGSVLSVTIRRPISWFKAFLMKRKFNINPESCKTKLEIV